MTAIKIWVTQTKTTQCLEIIAAFERHTNVQLKCFFTFKKKLFLILSCCVARLTAKKVNEIQGRGNITAVSCSRGFEVVIFLQKFQQQKKNRNPKNVVLSVIQKMFNINVEIVNKSQNFAQHPVLRYTILQFVIVKNKMHILAI